MPDALFAIVFALYAAGVRSCVRYYPVFSEATAADDQCIALRRAYMKAPDHPRISERLLI